MEGIKLMQGDCIEMMEEIEDGSVDMVLCDLPYGVTNCAWDKKIALDDLWKQYRRVVKKNGAVLLFGQMPFTAELVVSNRRDFKYMWIWQKHYKRGFLNANKQPLRTTENICVFYAKQCTYHPQMKKGKMRTMRQGKQSSCYGTFSRKEAVTTDLRYPLDVLDFNGIAPGKNIHPTQKPVELLEYLIKTYSNAGEVVLDNCMGSGSTGVACVSTGRRFVGIELDEYYFQVAKERIEEAVRKTLNKKCEEDIDKPHA